MQDIGDQERGSEGQMHREGKERSEQQSGFRSLEFQLTPPTFIQPRFPYSSKLSQPPVDTGPTYRYISLTFSFYCSITHTRSLASHLHLILLDINVSLYTTVKIILPISLSHGHRPRRTKLIVRHNTKWLLPTL